MFYVVLRLKEEANKQTTQTTRATNNTPEGAQSDKTVTPVLGAPSPEKLPPLATRRREAGSQHTRSPFLNGDRNLPTPALHESLRTRILVFSGC